jgi:hypothetical protein
MFIIKELEDTCDLREHINYNLDPLEVKVAFLDESEHFNNVTALVPRYASSNGKPFKVLKLNSSKVKDLKKFIFKYVK